MISPLGWKTAVSEHRFFSFSDTGWKLGGWQSILESPLEVIKSTVQPKKRGSLVEPGRVMGLSVCFAALSYAKNDTQGLSLHLCGAWFSPGVSSFTIPEQKEDNFFLILLHCPCCSSKEHKRPLQGTASATTNNNKKCGKLEGFKDATMACHPPSTALGVRELKKKNQNIGLQSICFTEETDNKPKNDLMLCPREGYKCKWGRKEGRLTGVGGLALKAQLDFKQSLQPWQYLQEEHSRKNPAIAKAPGRETTGRPERVDQNGMEGERRKGQRRLHPAIREKRKPGVWATLA